jgi:hypothetical protein
MDISDDDLWFHEVNEDPLLYVLEFRRRGVLGPPQYAPIQIFKPQPPVNMITVVHP